MIEPVSELRLYKARIYDTGAFGDDRLQVRILPYQADIDDSECDNLPKYPAFVKGQVVQGKTEKTDGKEKADYVIVAASDDFQVGYILGLQNQFEQLTGTSYSGSYNYKRIKHFLQERSAIGDDFSYDNISVQINSQSDTGGIMEFYNFRTGDKYTLMSTGTIFTIQGARIYMRVGTPANPLSTGPADFSAVDITPQSVTVTTPVFDVEAKKTILGKHYHKAVGTVSLLAAGTDGFELSPVSNIYM